MPFQPSNYASTFLGGLNAASNKQQAAYGAAALRAKARLESAEKGIAMAEKEAARNRSNAFTNTLIGAFGNVASAGLNAYGQHRADQAAWNQERYGSPSLTPFSGPLPSTTSNWAPPTAPPPVPGLGSSASVQYGSGASAPIFKPSTSYFG